MRTSSRNDTAVDAFTTRTIATTVAALVSMVFSDEVWPYRNSFFTYCQHASMQPMYAYATVVPHCYFKDMLSLQWPKGTTKQWPLTQLDVDITTMTAQVQSQHRSGRASLLHISQASIFLVKKQSIYRTRKYHPKRKNITMLHHTPPPFAAKSHLGRRTSRSGHVNRKVPTCNRTATANHTYMSHIGKIHTHTHLCRYVNICIYIYMLIHLHLGIIQFVIRYGHGESWRWRSWKWRIMEMETHGNEQWQRWRIMEMKNYRDGIMEMKNYRDGESWKWKITEMENHGDGES